MTSPITPVFNAINSGQSHLAEQLLQDSNLLLHLNDVIGKDAGQQWYGGFTCLHIACDRGDRDVVRLLLDLNVDVTITDARGRTPLHCAARATKPEIVKLLLGYGAPCKRQDIYGMTALHCLCDKNMPLNSKIRTLEQNIAMLLLEKCADLWQTQAQKDRWEGWTALHVASSRGRPDLVRLLLDYNALPDDQDVNGRTALHCVCEQSEPESPEVRAAYVEVAKLLLENRPTLWQVQAGVVYMKQTALHLAAFHGRHLLVKLLLTMGAVPMWKDERGCTPLHWLCGQRSRDKERIAAMLQVARLLLERSQNLLKVHNNMGQTALHFAAHHERMDMVRLLVESGADISEKDSKDKTAADWAEVAGYSDIVQYLKNPVAVSKNMSVVTIPPVNQDVYLDDTAEFVIYLSKPDIKVTWLRNGVPLIHMDSDNRCSVISGGTAHRIVIKNITLADEGLYQCVINGERDKLYGNLHVLGLTEFIHGLDDTKHSWSRDQKLNLVELTCMRLLFLGEHLAGKTSLARSIMGGKPYVTADHERTVVMESRNWTPTHNKSFNVVDLGGHHSYKASGHFFYCDGANNCSLLCHDIRSKAYEESFEWLKSALTRSPMSHIISVLTKYDTVPLSENADQLKEDFLEAFTRLIDQEMERLEPTVKISEVHKSKKSKKFRRCFEKYKELKDNLRDLTIVTSCDDKGKEKISKLIQMIMKISDLPQNQAKIPEQFQKFYVQIGNLGLRESPWTFGKLPEIETPIIRTPSSEKKERVITRAARVVKRMHSLRRSSSSESSGKQSFKPYPVKPNIQYTPRHLQYLYFSDAKTTYNATVGNEGTKEDKHLERVVKQCLDTLHRHGLIIWFSGTPALERYIFNDLTTFVEILKSIFRHDIDDVLQFDKLAMEDRFEYFRNNRMQFENVASRLKTQGHVSKSLLKLLLKAGHGIVDEKFVFDLFEYLGVGYRFHPHKQEEHLFIPWFIDTKPPKDVEKLVIDITSFSPNELPLKCKITGNIPRDFFYYLCVRLAKQLLVNQDSDDQVIWCDGLYVPIDQLSLLILYYPKEGMIELYIKVKLDRYRSDRLNEAWDRIREIYDECDRLSEEWWPGLMEMFLLICTHCRMVKIKNPQELDLEHIFNRADSNHPRERIKCKATNENIPAALNIPLPRGKQLQDQYFQSLLDHMEEKLGSGRQEQHTDVRRNRRNLSSPPENYSGTFPRIHKKSPLTEDNVPDTDFQELLSQQMKPLSQSHETLVSTNFQLDVIDKDIHCVHHALQNLQETIVGQMKPDAELVDKMYTYALLTYEERAKINKTDSITGKVKCILLMVDRRAAMYGDETIERLSSVLKECSNFQNQCLGEILKTELEKTQVTRL